MYGKPASAFVGAGTTAGGTLAFTGFHTALFVAAALALLLIGAVLVRISCLGRYQDGVDA